MTKNNEQIIIDGDKFEKAENEPINQEVVNKFIEDTDKFYPKNSKIMYDYNAKDCEQFSSDSVCCYCKNLLCYEFEEQLKRKEQECEELKKHLEEESKLGHKAVQEEADTFFDLLKAQNQLDQLKKENEELKLENKKLENANNALHDDLFEIKQKIKQYKEDSEACKKCYENNLKNLKDAEFNLTKLADKYMKLEKTLEEIREIAEKWQYADNAFELSDEILQKINEVIDE